MIEIKMTKYSLFLRETELVRLLGTDLELWQEGIMRGKGIKRSRQHKEREIKRSDSVIPIKNSPEAINQSVCAGSAGKGKGGTGEVLKG